jgi:hypothetical protein
MSRRGGVRAWSGQRCASDLDAYRTLRAERCPLQCCGLPLRDFNSDEGFKVALDQSIDAAIAESGRANLGAVGNHLLRLLPDFDPRNYGFRKLSDLVEKNPSLRLVREKTASGTQVVYAERK